LQWWRGTKLAGKRKLSLRPYLQALHPKFSLPGWRQFTDGWTELKERISVPAGADITWRILQDIPRVACCLGVLNPAAHHRAGSSVEQ
jgi:hypothetical protein